MIRYRLNDDWNYRISVFATKEIKNVIEVIPSRKEKVFINIHEKYGDYYRVTILGEAKLSGWIFREHITIDNQYELLDGRFNYA